MLHLILYVLLALIVAVGLFLVATRFLPAGEQIAPVIRDEPVWELPVERNLQAEDVDTIRLPVALRGYRFAETDVLLDRLAGELRARDAEIARLRGEHDLEPPPASEPAEPELTEPELTAPELTEPEFTAPELTEPAPTEPELAEPTEPSLIEPSLTEPSITEPSITEPSITEPSITAPSLTEPELTEPDADVPPGTEASTATTGDAVADDRT